MAKLKDIMSGAVKENLQKLNLLTKEMEVTKIDLSEKTSSALDSM